MLLDKIDNPIGLDISELSIILSLKYIITDINEQDLETFAVKNSWNITEDTPSEILM